MERANKHGQMLGKQTRAALKNSNVLMSFLEHSLLQQSFCKHLLNPHFLEIIKLIVLESMHSMELVLYPETTALKLLETKFFAQE